MGVRVEYEEKGNVVTNKVREKRVIADTNLTSAFIC